jgi:hypothetical protein
MPELAQLEYDHSLHESRNKGDAKLYVRFFPEVVPDDDATKKEGRRMFREVTMIQIQVPGDKRNIVIREARPEDIERFQAIYDKTIAGGDGYIDGTPLKQWPQMNRAQVEELKYLGFQTVEHVAGASDGILGKYPGLRELQKRAVAFLETQANNAPVERLQSELATRDELLAGMQAQLDEMKKALAEAHKK